MFKLPARLAVCAFALAAALGLSACASKPEASGADARQVAAALAGVHDDRAGHDGDQFGGVDLVEVGV